MAALDESQIRRYSRHILLREVGGRGQAKLLTRPIQLVGRGEALSVAATYLAAAGAPLRLGPGVVLGAFLAGQRLEDFNADAGAGEGAPWLTLSTEGGAGTTPAAVFVGEGGLAFRGVGACHECFDGLRAGVAALRGAEPVTLGSLAALLAQRLVLELSEPLGALAVGGALPRTMPCPPCAHRPTEDSQR